MTASYFDVDVHIMLFSYKCFCLINKVFILIVTMAEKYIDTTFNYEYQEIFKFLKSFNLVAKFKGI